MRSVETFEMTIDADQALILQLPRIYREAPVGLCCFDTKLRYVHINDWLAAINGCTIEEHLGRTVGEVIPNVSAGIESQLRHVIETGEPILGGTVGGETGANPAERKCFEHNYYPVKSDGTIVGVSCAVRDITDRKRAEEALRKARDELEIRVRQRTAELEEANERLGREITERARSEKAQRKADERLRLLLESTSAIPWIADARTWQFTYVGPQVVALGYPVENWYEQDFWV